MKNLTLRTRLYFLILIILIPLLALQFVSMYQRYQDTVQSEFRSSQELGEAITAAFNNHLENIWNIEKSISFAIASDLSLQEIRIYLNDLLRDYPLVRVFGWIDADLNILVNTFQEVGGTPLNDRGYIQRILSGEEYIVSDLLKSRTTGQLAYLICRGFWEDEELKGIAFAEVDVTKLGTVFPVTRNRLSSDFGLIDSTGMIIYRSTYPDLSFEHRQLKPDSLARLALQGEIVNLHKFHSSVFGELRMGICLPVKGINWAVFVTDSVDEVIGGIRKDLIHQLCILTGVTLFSVITGLLIMRSFTKPIFALQNATQSLAKGDFSARVTIEGSDELAKTGRIFNHMADWIQELQFSRLKFLQSAAHELRNPMAGIKGVLALIRRKVETGKPLDNILKMLNIIEREVDRLANLLNQIMEAFRSQQGEITIDLEKKAINLVEVVKSAVLPFQTTNEDRSIRLQTEQSELYICGDYDRLEEVFLNLLSNAIKYSPIGTDITVNVKVEDEWAIVAIQDQGIGIPEEQIKKVFDGFYRASNTFPRDPGGMGLGLYISKQIVQRHNGEIWVKNNQTNGSTFYVKLKLTMDREELGWRRC